jgi:hypothetical protein
MATVNITHSVETPSGTALEGIMIRATLSGQGFRTDDSAVAREQWFTTDDLGAVTMPLERTDQITPANLHYVIEVQLPDAYGGPELYTILATAASSLADARVNV